MNRTEFHSESDWSHEPHVTCCRIVKILLPYTEGIGQFEDVELVSYSATEIAIQRSARLPLNSEFHVSLVLKGTETLVLYRVCLFERIADDLYQITAEIAGFVGAPAAHNPNAILNSLAALPQHCRTEA